MIPFLLRLVLVFTFLASFASAQESVRQADAACAGCHRDIYRKYVTTPMANASGLAAERYFPGEFTHAPSDVHYQVKQTQAGVFLNYRDGRNPRAAGTHELKYFLGSGHLGTTYLYAQDGYLLESPVAWYASTQTYDMKPGFGQVTEMPAALPMGPGCLRCHMSGVTDPLPGSRDRYAALPFQQSGITCESCHGDTSAHVHSGGKAAVVNPAKLSPERRDAVCMSCHLEGNVALAKANQNPLDYRPGDRLSEYLTFSVLTDGDSLSRGVSEVEQFATSRCKRVSGDRMSCSSCHDPHGSPSPAEKVAFFRAKCLTCHSAPAFAQTHHSENPDCTSCHMPRNGAQNTPHVAWTDHRILRSSEVQPTLNSLTVSGQRQHLKFIFSPGADDRDAALALYNAVIAGDLQEGGSALQQLKAAYVPGTHDTALLEALGALSAMSGKTDQANTVLRELLQQDPSNRSALSNLGVLLARQGKYEEATKLWATAFSKNEDDYTLGHNLAVVECSLGNSEAGRQFLMRTLKYSPGSRSAWELPCSAAVKH